MSGEENIVDDLSQTSAATASRRAQSTRGHPRPKPQLVSRHSLYNMATTIRTIKIKDLVDGLGFIYNHVEEWGKTFPDANGKQQSPVNINSGESEFDDSMNSVSLAFNYSLSREIDMFNNGHTAVVNLRYKPADGGLMKETLPATSVMSGGPLALGQEYELCELRFHWGRDSSRGSEHTVNTKAFPTELHLIHFNATQYSCIEEALGKPDGVAIVAIFIMLGREHSGIKVLVDGLEDILYKGKQRTIGTAFNPNCLLPDPMLRDFWTYTGSLTSPPCSENVTWIILRYPLTISCEQLEEFRRLHTFPKGEPLPTGEDGCLVDNFRPTQSLNDRVIRANFPQ